MSISSHLKELGHMLYLFAIVGAALVSTPLACARKTWATCREFDQTIAQIADLGWYGKDGGETVSAERTEGINSILWSVEEMKNLKKLFRQAMGKEPKGWIMGIKEYLDLKNEIHSRMDEEQRRRCDHIVQFQGLPVHIKCSRGIELAMDPEAAIHFKKIREKIGGYRETMT